MVSLTGGHRTRGWNAPQLVLAAALLLVAAEGCGGGLAARPGDTPDATAPPASGGTLSLPLVGEPTCADWLAACSLFVSGATAMRAQTVPAAMSLVDGRYQATPLLAGEPVMAPGPPQRVTYRINPRAVWSDGAPITSADFLFTWDQAVNGTNVASRSGWDRIDRVDDTDPTTAVVTYKAATASWRLGFGIVLPKHLLDGRVRSTEMRDGYAWSGGPWTIAHWSRGREIELVPNPRYWGARPHADRLVWKIVPDTAAALDAYRRGQVALLLGAPVNVNTAALRAIPDSRVEVAMSLGYTSVELNTQRPPVDQLPVRQALAFATDRDALATELLGNRLPDVQPIQSFSTPAAGAYYVESFRRYRRDLSEVARLMQTDGWSKGQDGTWTKAGRRAEFELVATDGTTAELLGRQWTSAGFAVTVRGVSVNDRVELVRHGDYQVALTSQGGFEDPGRCSQFCSNNIPSAANGEVGQNVTRVRSSALDDAWERVNAELDDARRVEAVRGATDLTAELAPALPLFPDVAVLVVNTARLGGPIRLQATAAATFRNINEWWCQEGRC